MRGTTDSERYFRLVLQCIAACGDDEQGLRTALGVLTREFPEASLNALLLTPTHMFGIHINSRASAPISGLRRLFDSDEEIPHRHTDEYFAMDYRLPDDAVHVISSGIDPQGWTPVPENTAASVDLATLELTRLDLPRTEATLNPLDRGCTDWNAQHRHQPRCEPDEASSPAAAIPTPRRTRCGRWSALVDQLARQRDVRGGEVGIERQGLLGRAHLDGQVDAHGGALVLATGECQGAVVSLDDRLGDHQSEADAGDGGPDWSAGSGRTWCPGVARDSLAIPTPVSLTTRSMPSPCLSRPTVMRPPAGVNLIALDTRLSITCRSRLASAVITTWGGRSRTTVRPA